MTPFRFSHSDAEAWAGIAKSLANGLEVILHQDHRLPLAAVNLWYHVGSANEATGRTGFAHLFEHLMFQGSAQYDEEYFSGNGTLYKTRVWETNFIPNAPDMALYGWKERGAGGINVILQMGKNDMGNHISEFPVGTYKKAHRHGPGAHLVLLSGDSGFSLLWTKEDRSDMVKCDWKVGTIVTVPGDGTFHQHFNSGTTRARYMALRDGPGGFLAPNHKVGGDVSIKDGGIQVEYEDEAREIHEIYEAELAKKGIKCNMKAFIPYCTGDAGVTEERFT